MKHPTRFENLLDLARLPYFEVKDGRLVLADASLGGAIDMHTHLALSFVLPARIDLQREWSETEHYLPKERAIELDVYVNRNFDGLDLSKLKRDLAFGSLTAGGMRRTHTIPNLAREMGELGVTQSALLAIDFPAFSDNARRWLRAIKGRQDILCFGSVHPWARDVAGKLDEQIALGARGIKVHPAVQLVRPDEPRAMALYRLCGERSLPILFHCGPVGIELGYSRYLSQVRHYERAVAENPDTIFVLGHSGAMQMAQGLSLCQRYENVWLELSSQSLTNVKRIVDEAPSARIVFGSDWPFYHQAVPLAKVFLATEGNDELRRAVLFGNAARLLATRPHAR
jgi:predicted TIM-barrel fold metal-dependent hydrolase